jgi:hypothetical protein
MFSEGKGGAFLADIPIVILDSSGNCQTQSVCEQHSET